MKNASFYLNTDLYSLEILQIQITLSCVCAHKLVLIAHLGKKLMHFNSEFILSGSCEKTLFIQRNHLNTEFAPYRKMARYTLAINLNFLKNKKKVLNVMKRKIKSSVLMLHDYRQLEVSLIYWWIEYLAIRIYISNFWTEFRQIYC